MIDTHAHLDGCEFADDIDDVMQRAHEAGIEKIFVPGITLESVDSVTTLCQHYPNYAYPMIGLHPEEVRADWRDVLDRMKSALNQPHATNGKTGCGIPMTRQDNPVPFIAIGEVGLDYYWSREYEKEQLEAFACQIEWSIEHHLPLMIHLRKAQNEAVKLMRSYRQELTAGGVFHCFSGNAHEAEELLAFEGFTLGIGGIVTFKKSTLPDTLRTAVPLDRIVLETDAPYMAPTPMRGKRNESSYIPFIAAKLAEVYDTDIATIDRATTATVKHIFRI